MKDIANFFKRKIYKYDNDEICESKVSITFYKEKKRKVEFFVTFLKKRPILNPTTIVGNAFISSSFEGLISSTFCVVELYQILPVYF